MFKKLDYKKWCIENKLHELFHINLDTYGTITTKIVQGKDEAVDPRNSTPLLPELDDLTRLHYLVRTRKVTTILEFGVGKSTVVLADAIQKNKRDFEDFVVKNIRRANPFEIHSIDTSRNWIRTCKQSMDPSIAQFAHFHLSKIEMTTFNGRACTMYQHIPNICPDLIYLDSPDQFSVKNYIRGISTASADRVPMSADILLMEPFLLPGTLIVVDGRTANARFLKNNLQRDWEYTYHIEEDIHTFELIEAPLGELNRKQLMFCLGPKAIQLRGE